MDVSHFLAQALGLYFLLISIVILMQKNYVAGLMADLFKHPSVHFLLGFNVLILGILLVLSHREWTASWEVMITIIAWITLIKGFFNLAFPQIAKKMTTKVTKSSIALGFSLAINVLLSLYFCYFGFWVL